MNSYYGRTYQSIQLKIPLSVWAGIALAMGIFFALVIIFASIDL
jgi:hypothetical protein